jgi:hypothetical protein
VGQVCRGVGTKPAPFPLRPGGGRVTLTEANLAMPKTSQAEDKPCVSLARDG